MTRTGINWGWACTLVGLLLLAGVLYDAASSVKAAPVPVRTVTVDEPLPAPHPAREPLARDYPAPPPHAPPTAHPAHPHAPPTAHPAPAPAPHVASPAPSTLYPPPGPRVAAIPPQPPQQHEPPASNTPRKRPPKGPFAVDLPHQWDGCGTLCYLGAFAMSASAVEPSLSYLDVVRYSNPAEIASDMDVLATAARGLGYTVEVSATTRDGRDSFVAKFEDVGRAGPTFAGAKEALEALQAHVLAGRVAIAHVDIAYILEDRQRASPEYNDLGHAPHFLAVVGFDADHVYVHDPQKWQAFAQYMPLRKAAFLEAWGAQDHRTLLAVKSGTRASRDVAFSAMAHRLAETPHEMVRSARRFERKGTVEEMQMVALMSAAYRRRVTSTWLAERGLSESASLLAQSASVFEGIRPNLTASQVSGILRQAADLESRAVSLLVGAP